MNLRRNAPPPQETRPSELLDRYRTVRQRSRYLTRGLAPEDQVVQSMVDVSPTKWHLAHTTWFFETFVLAPHLPGYRLHDEAYPYLFNSYYVQAGERHCRDQRGYLSRPTVDEVTAYREAVDEAMEELLARDLPEVVRELVVLGTHHEQQHQELMLTDVKHVFSVNPLRPSYQEMATPGPGGPAPDAVPDGAPVSPDPLRWISFDEGIYEVGWDGEGFAYDNEEPRHRRFLEPFALGHRLVTNGEFLEFMADGGYERPELWMSEGWARGQEEGWSEPFYWERREGEWWSFTLSGMGPVEPREPVCHVNWYEADAYARWAGARLPREEEWEVAAAEAPIRGNFGDAGRFHPVPAPAEDGGGLVQLFGDVWEWTGSPYTPYPGFRPAPGPWGSTTGSSW